MAEGRRSVSVVRRQLQRTVRRAQALMQPQELREYLDQLAAEAADDGSDSGSDGGSGDSEDAPGSDVAGPSNRHLVNSDMSDTESEQDESSDDEEPSDEEEPPLVTWFEELLTANNIDFRQPDVRRLANHVQHRFPETPSHDDFFEHFYRVVRDLKPNMLEAGWIKVVRAYARASFSMGGAARRNELFLQPHRRVRAFRTVYYELERIVVGLRMEAMVRNVDVPQAPAEDDEEAAAEAALAFDAAVPEHVQGTLGSLQVFKVWDVLRLALKGETNLFQAQMR